jgi:hypothetical protein
MSCVLAGSAEFRESEVGQKWVRRQLRRGDIFVTRSKPPYELDWKSPVGEELDFIIVHLAVDRFLAALEAVYPGKADKVEVIAFSNAMKRSRICASMRRNAFDAGACQRRFNIPVNSTV